MEGYPHAIDFLHLFKTECLHSLSFGLVVSNAYSTKLLWLSGNNEAPILKKLAFVFVYTYPLMACCYRTGKEAQFICEISYTQPFDAGESFILFHTATFSSTLPAQLAHCLRFHARQRKLTNIRYHCIRNYYDELRFSYLSIIDSNLLGIQ